MHKYSSVPVVIGTKIVMLLNGSKCERGKIISLLRQGRVIVECEAVAIEFHNRIPPNNGEKTLEPGESFTFDLSNLVLAIEWQDVALNNVVIIQM